MAAQPAKTTETAVQDEKYARLKLRFSALKKVGHLGAQFLLLTIRMVEEAACAFTILRL